MVSVTNTPITGFQVPKVFLLCLADRGGVGEQTMLKKQKPDQKLV